MAKRLITILAVLGLVGFQLTGCGTQTSGLDTTAINQTTETSISSSVNDAIAISSITDNTASLGIMGLEAVTNGSSCPSVSKNLIEQNPSTYTILIDFGNGCIPNNYPFSQVTTSGYISMTVTLFTDTATGKITGETIDAQKNIVRTRWDGASLSISGTTNIIKNLSWAGNTLTNVERSVSVNEERIAVTSFGRVVMHHLIALDFTYADTVSDGIITKRIINGTGTVDHELARVTASVSIVNLTLVQGCCHPVDGSINITLTRNSNGSVIGNYLLVYTSSTSSNQYQCSDVASLNGKQITLNPCE